MKKRLLFILFFVNLFVSSSYGFFNAIGKKLAHGALPPRKIAAIVFWAKLLGSILFLLLITIIILLIILIWKKHHKP